MYYSVTYFKSDFYQTLSIGLECTQVSVVCMLDVAKYLAFLSLRGRLLSSYLGCPDVKKKASIDGISANSQPNIVPIQA